ncbi:MAG: FAD-dependent monooxygenase [Acidimicrobiaceae bacterium]|nr:FAD-dependent monooxygenase [Acidimicrobiaceae bacterium]
MTRAARIAIIGGGIGGVSAAHALSRRGFEVTVFEAAPELKEIGAGVALGPNAMKVLRSLDLEDAVRAVGWEREFQVSRHWRTGRIVRQSTTARADMVARYGAAGCSVHRADLLDVLSAKLPEKVDVTLGRRCVSASSEGEVASAKFSDGSEIEADVVLGADGIHSAVRTSLFGPDEPRFTGKVAYRSVIPVDALPDGEDLRDGGGSLGPHGTIVIYGVRRGELINVVCHHDDDTYKHESWIVECDRAELLDVYKDWNSRLLRLFAASEVWYKWALYDRDPIPQWTSGRVTLLGDAAHPMLPYLGQGACQALEDGSVLAMALDSMPDDVPGALRLYERVRRPRASRVVLTSRARGVDNHLVSPIAQLKRDTMIALRKRFSSDVGGRGDAWIPAYDASRPEVLAV